MPKSVPFSVAEIRESFLNYFAEKQHTIVPSSTLVPYNDPTLLFTNAGMVQFKNYFLGSEVVPYPVPRATSAQCCVRAGGKHNDLENVGYTARHHTFFEMLGNFSFGDYFKKEAIEFAWFYLTEILKLPKEKLWVTVYEDDDEAADIWIQHIKIDPNRLSRCGEKDNFWAMGDTGPCGPCSEIFYDHGPEVAGGPPGSPDADGDRYIEIWNLVFMQFNRAADGTLTPLPKPSVDTGMGLERIAAVLQGVHSNYAIDLFQNLMKAIHHYVPNAPFDDVSIKVLADHIRSCSFLIQDGVTPSNEGRGYVLRRIIRRAIRHGHKLGFKGTFFYKLVAPLVEQMADAYPKLLQQQTYIENVLKREEELFAHTLEQGLKLLQQALDQLKGHTIPGEIIFKLYDTYGFPLDLTADIAREKGLFIDEDGFIQEMEKQKLRSQAASRFSADYSAAKGSINLSTCFTGYKHLEEETRLLGIRIGDHAVDSLEEGQEAALILERTPFYAESGGQVGDQGYLTQKDAIFEVKDTQKLQQAVLHIGRLIKGQLSLNAMVQAKVDNMRRRDAAAHHSATHLLHAALRKIIGEHVLQKGSLVEPERLRFDFSHFEPLTSLHLEQIEIFVNDAIRQNLPVETIETTPDEAKKLGALALFGEKYGETVRVLRMDDISTELCGGTHVSRTGDIGYFKITSESGIAAGVRRIEAVAGRAAENSARSMFQQWAELAKQLKTDPSGIPEKIAQMQESIKQQEKTLQTLQDKLLLQQGRELLLKAKKVSSIQLLVECIELTPQELRRMVEILRERATATALLLFTKTDDKIALVAGVSADLTKKIHAGQWVQHVAQILGGKGGGRPDIAQGGGEKLEALSLALQTAEHWIESRIQISTSLSS